MRIFIVFYLLSPDKFAFNAYSAVLSGLSYLREDFIFLCVL